MLVPKKKEVSGKITEIIRLCLNEQYDSAVIGQIEDSDQLLRFLISNSTWVTNLVALIEDEFDIEIEDDDICLELFQSVEKLADVVIKSHSQL